MTEAPRSYPEGESQLPLQYEDGPDYCTVRDAQGRDFALTMWPDLMKAMERALAEDIAELSRPPAQGAREPMRAALEKIASRHVTDRPLWWQQLARDALMVSDASPLSSTHHSAPAMEGELDTVVQLIHKHVDVCDLFDGAQELIGVEDAAKAILSALSSTDPRCTCGAIVNPNIPHARSCPLSSTHGDGK